MITSMTTPPLETLFKRILLPLDAGGADAASLEYAIRAAARFRAELVGIFVEDSELMRLAGLPFARETAHLSAVTRPLNPADMARALRVRAEIVRARLQERATQAQVSWSFRIVQGELLAEQLGESAGSDLLILEVGAHRTRPGRGAGTATRRIFSHTSCTVWLRRAQAADERPVVALLDGAPSNMRVLAVASQFARRDGKHLLVMIPAADAAEFERRAKQAAAALAASGVEAEFQPLAREAAANLVQVVAAARGKLLVIGRDSPLASGAAYQRLLEDVPCEVVLAR
jgi:hypothetical protein